jgi:mRNA interferase MazF
MNGKTVYKSFEVWLVESNPTRGSEISETRPAVIISPDSPNKFLNTVLIAPLTHTTKSYPTRLDYFFDNEKGQIATDQMRAVDKSRLTKKLGEIDTKTAKSLCSLLVENFKY